MSTLKFVEPMIPAPSDDVPVGDDWIHEVKYDGYRAQIVKDEAGVRVFTRNGYDWSSKFWPIALEARTLPCTSAIIDGEMIVTDEKGASHFPSLPEAIRTQPSRLVFVAFDILHMDGEDMRGKPLLERRTALWKLVQPADNRIQYSHHFEGHGPAFFQAVDGMGLEGIVSKKASSRYRSGPTKNWLKIKCYEESEYEVAGILREPGSAPLALMVTRDPERRYVGSAIVALKQDMRERLWRRVQEKKGAPPRGVKKPLAKWTQPGLVGRVRHLRGEERLRHATLKDLKEEE
ncbi:ATP-dependent DNA ligase [Pseudaminobacter sp. NGMCC 1.201702]|uniref:ATP-dependent DNA ligase n=1 Tax=Pseudaminobacter sp. NGMCC 1.201702 TaxID=3391825 RepID=UPI0039F0BA97